MPPTQAAGCRSRMSAISVHGREAVHRGADEELTEIFIGRAGSSYCRLGYAKCPPRRNEKAGLPLSEVVTQPLLRWEVVLPIKPFCPKYRVEVYFSSVLKHFVSIIRPCAIIEQRNNKIISVTGFEKLKNAEGQSRNRQRILMIEKWGRTKKGDIFVANLCWITAGKRRYFYADS